MVNYAQNRNYIRTRNRDISSWNGLTFPPRWIWTPVSRQPDTLLIISTDNYLRSHMETLIQIYDFLSRLINNETYFQMFDSMSECLNWNWDDMKMMKENSKRLYTKPSKAVPIYCPSDVSSASCLGCWMLRIVCYSLPLISNSIS